MPTLADIKRQRISGWSGIPINSNLSTDEMEWWMLSQAYGKHDIDYLRFLSWKEYTGSNLPATATRSDHEAYAIKQELGIPQNANYSLNDLRYLWYTLAT